MLAASATIAFLGAATGFAWSFVPPGNEKAGRILIDDRFCGIWEPTARQLDTEWYGDFPTYSFTSLAEWLGKWYSVDANTTRPYDDELLSHYDVLIIKTPEEPIPDAETAAIERFVRRGGGLLLVGDHTNLLGMGTHLNALSAKHGIQFRYDSVSDGLTGGFVNCSPPSIGRHLGCLARRETGVHDLLLASAFRRCTDRAGGRKLPARAARLRRLELLRPARPAPGDGARPDRAGRDRSASAAAGSPRLPTDGLVIVRRLQPRSREAGDGSHPRAEPGAEPVRAADPVRGRRYCAGGGVDRSLDGAIGHGVAGGPLRARWFLVGCRGVGGASSRRSTLGRSRMYRSPK